MALRAPTLVFGLSNFDRKKAGKSFLFLPFLSLSLSTNSSPLRILFLSLFFSFLLLFSFSLSHFFLLIFSLQILFLSFCFAFPLFFSFLLSFFSSYFSFHFSLGSSPPIWSIIDHMGQRRQFPPHFLMSTCVALIFPYFSFIPYSSFMTSHSHVAHCESSLEVNHMALPSVTLLGCHVSSNTIRLEKREIPTTSESNEIRHGS